MRGLTRVDSKRPGVAYIDSTMSKPTLEQRPGAAAPLPRTVVTGATSGIGRALAIRLAESGVPVIAIGRNQDLLGELASRNELITALAADLGQPDALPGLARRLVSEHPDLGCLINNAGIQCDLRMDDAGYDDRQLRGEVDVNLVAPLLLTQALLPHFQRRPVSWVVNLTSGLGYVPKRTAAVYSATKAGLHLFTQALRVQMQGSAVRVAEVVMPLVDTPMTEGRGRGKLSADRAARELIAGLNAGRLDIRVGRARALPSLQRWAPGLLARIMQRD